MVFVERELKGRDLIDYCFSSFSGGPTSWLMSILQMGQVRDARSHCSMHYEVVRQ